MFGGLVLVALALMGGIGLMLVGFGLTDGSLEVTTGTAKWSSR